MKMLRSAAMISTLLWGGALAGAAPPECPPPRRPPEAAFTACASAQEGDGCTVSVDGQELAGKCVRVPEHVPDDAGKLVCRPPHPPGPPRS